MNYWPQDDVFIDSKGMHDWERNGLLFKNIQRIDGDEGEH